MTNALRERPLTYPVPSEGRWGWSAPPRPYLPHHAVAAGARVARPAGRTTSQAGAEGTKQLLAQYGDRLIRVRYRYDAQRKKRLQTVELVVAEPDWKPQRSFNGRRSPKTRSFASRVALADVATRDMV